MAAGAGFHADHARRVIRKVLQYLTARQLLLHLLVSLLIQPHDMKDVLCQVHAHGRNIHLGLLLPRLMVDTPFHPGAVDAV
jgi:hypothetical protein